MPLELAANVALLSKSIPTPMQFLVYMCQHTLILLAVQMLVIFSFQNTSGRILKCYSKWVLSQRKWCIIIMFSHRSIDLFLHLISWNRFMEIYTLRETSKIYCLNQYFVNSFAQEMMYNMLSKRSRKRQSALLQMMPIQSFNGSKSLQDAGILFSWRQAGIHHLESLALQKTPLYW